MTRIGIIGAGNIGAALARGFAARGHDIVIANSRGPHTLSALVDELGARVTAGTAEEAADAGEFVVVAVPFHAYRDLPPAPLNGKIVLDTANYYWERDGRVPAIERAEATVSGLVQAHLAGAKLAKAFNSIGAGEILTDGSSAGTPGRRALATASDHPEAAELAAAVYDEFGFDAVVLGPLSESWRMDRDQPGYGVRQTRAELEADLARASR